MRSSKEKVLFGKYLRKLRLERNLSLRKFSSLIEMDPGNLSRIESGVFPPPSEDKVIHIAKTLGLDRGNEEWIQLMDYFYISKKEIPGYVLDEEDLLEKLPVIFRSLTGSKLKSEDLDKLIELIKNNY